MEEAIDVDYLDLPNHILEKMFQDLPVEDLKNVMLLNSNYYDFVINSFNLSRKFKLVIKKRDLEVNSVNEALFNCERMFLMVEIRPDVDRSSFTKKIFRKFGKHVKSLNASNVSSSDLVEILATTTHLKEADLAGEFDYDVKSNKNITLRNLTSLKIYWNRGVERCELFSKVTTLKKLDLNDYPYKMAIRLFQNQTDLEDLKLNCFTSDVFWDDISIFNTPFQLKTFHYYCINTSKNISRPLHLYRFLTTQHNLKDIEIKIYSGGPMVFVEQILKMKHVQKLTIKCMDAQPIAEHEENLMYGKKNTNVKFLSIYLISFDRISMIIKNFVGLETLEIGVYDQFFEIKFISFGDLPNLKKIKLKLLDGYDSQHTILRCNFPNFACSFHESKIKEFTICYPEDSKNTAAWRIFCVGNPNITSITCKPQISPHRRIVDTLDKINNDVVKIIAKNLKKLEILRISNTPSALLNKETIEIVCENCDELKELQLKLIGTEEDYADVFEKFADKLKQIKCEFTYQDPKYLYFIEC